MIDLFYRNATPADIDFLISHLRKRDRDTMRAAYGAQCDISRIIHMSIDMTPEAQACLDPRTGQLIAIFGIAHMQTAEGMLYAPWLLATESMYAFRRQLLIEGQSYIRESSNKYPCLTCFIGQEFPRMAKRMERAGFTIYPPEVRGPLNLYSSKAEMMRRQ